MKSDLSSYGRTSLVKFGCWFKVLASLFLMGLWAQKASAQTRETLEFSVKAYDSLFSTLGAGQESARIGDMLYDVDQLKAWRDHLQNRLDGKITAEGGFDFTSAKPWTDGVIYYVYDKSVEEGTKILFESAIREWQQVASLNFVQGTSKNYLYVKFTGWASDAPMNSFIGMRGNAQVLNVAGWGNKIDCAHELGHSLGLTHEQCRSDRDTYVTIVATNLSVNPATDVNYAIVPKSINRTAYDYDSLMHYPRDAFAKNAAFPTLLAKSPNEKWSDGSSPEEIGQKSHLSDGDKAAMAAQYGAPLEIGGTIRDAAGKPLAGIQITLTGDAAYRGKNPISTDAAGKYVFTGIPGSSGNYTVTPSQPGTSFTQAFRSIQITSANQSSVDFTSVDSAPPDLVITVPAVSGVYAAAPVVSGTASDSVALKEVRVALARTSDLVWWNWTEGTWGTATFDWSKNVRVADGKTSWSTPLPNLSAGGYQVHLQSVDVSDNASPWLFRHFFVDPEPPTVAVAQPIPNSTIPEFMTIRGTATDGAGTGIKDNRVYFTLYQNGDFWTGFNWKANTSAQDPDVLLYADVVNGQWIYNSVPGDHSEHGGGGSTERSGTYYISLFAHDNAGNLSVPTAGINSVQFTVDNSPPSVAIGDPANGSTITNLFTISGTAKDAKSLESVRLYLYRYSDGQYWDGRAWGGGGSAILPVAVDTNRGTWISTGPMPSVTTRDASARLSNGGYDIIAFAVDSAGNQTRIDSIVTVEYFPEFTYTAGSYSDSVPNNNNDNWDNPANWSPYGVPGLEDMAVIPTGSPIFTGTKTIHGVRLTGGNLRSGTLIIPAGGLMRWSDGTLSANLNIDPGADLIVTGNGTKTIASGMRVEVNGESHWDGDGPISASGGVVFRNNGTLTVNGNPHLLYYNNGVYPIGTFENFGTLIREGTGTLLFAGDYGGWALTNAGVLNITGGTILLNNTVYLGGSLTGTGRMIAKPAALHLDGNLALEGGTLELATGSIEGGGSITGNGTFVWSGGNVTGDIFIDSEANLLMTGSDKTITSGARVRNSGHALWESGNLLTSGNSRFWNTGTLEIAGAVNAYYYNNGVYPRGEFINEGVVIKRGAAPAGFAPDYGGLHFNNNGELHVDEGILTLAGGGFSTNGIYNISAGAQLDWAAGETHTLAGSIGIKGPGRVRVAGGTVTGTGATLNIAEGSTYEHHLGSANGDFIVEGPGTFQWSGGTLNAAMNWKPNLNVLISGDAEKNLEAGRIVQEGSVLWQGTGRIRAVGGSEFRNNGVFEAEGESGFIYYNNGVYPVAAFVNAGTFRRTAAGATKFLPDYGGWIFTNIGTVDIRSGELDLEVNALLGSGGRFTGPGSTRVIAGSVTLYGTNTVDAGTLELANGNLTSDSGTLAGNGTFAWTGGSVSGSTIVATTNFTITGAADKIMASGSSLRNRGTAVWTGTGLIRTTGGTVFENDGRFEVQNDSTCLNYNNGVYPKAAFNNYGTFIKTAGTNKTVFANDYSGASFNNRGEIIVQSGTLALGGGGLWNGGTIQVTEGSELELFAERYEISGKPVFTGTTRIKGAEFALKDATNTVTEGSQLALESGSVTGTGSFSGTGALSWSAGTMTGAIRLGEGFHWALKGDTEKLFATGTIDNYGSATWEGVGALKGEGAALLNNYGSFVLKSDASFTYYNNGVYPRARFANYGLLQKSGGSGQSIFNNEYSGWQLFSTGSIQIDTGALSLRGENFLTNSIIKGAGRLRVDGGSVTARGTNLLAGGTFELASGLVTGESAYTGSGVFEWSGGELQGMQIIAPGGQMHLTGDATKNIGGGSTLQNEGVITWSGSGAIHGIGQTRFVNRGTLVATSDSGFLYYNNGAYPGAVLENTGVIRKTGATGKTEFFGDYGGWRFANQGTLEIQAGTVAVGQNYEATDATRIQLLASGTNSHGVISFPGAANFSGSLSVVLTNGFVPGSDTALQLATYESRAAGATFISPVLPQLPAGRTWNLDYREKSLDLSIINAAANSSPARLANGVFELSLNGPAGKYALLQATTNLIEWFNVQTNQPFSGQFKFSDPGATNSSRFYRTLIVQ